MSHDKWNLTIFTQYIYTACCRVDGESLREHTQQFRIAILKVQKQFLLLIIVKRTSHVGNHSKCIARCCIVLNMEIVFCCLAIIIVANHPSHNTPSNDDDTETNPMSLENERARIYGKKRRNSERSECSINDETSKKSRLVVVDICTEQRKVKGKLSLFFFVIANRCC